MTDKLLKTIITSLENVKGEDIVYFDTRGKSILFDAIVIVTGKTQVHTKALAKGLVHDLKKSGYKKHRLEGQTHGQWLIADWGHIIVHIMLPDVREFYALEKLWG